MWETGSRKLYIRMWYYVSFPNYFGNKLRLNGRDLLIRSDPVCEHGMNDRSKIAAY